MHEIKHDGFRLMARRDPVDIAYLTRNGYDWKTRYPTIVAAVDRPKVRFCLIDGEATGVAIPCALPAAGPYSPAQ